MQTHGIAPLLFDLREYNVTNEELISIVQKILRKEKFNRDDNRLLAKIEKAFIDKYGRMFAASFPKREWSRLSGRQYKVLNEQGERYGLTCLTEPEINLFDLPKQLHELLCKIASKWDDLDSEDGMNGPASPWLEKYREQRAKQERLKLQQMRQELLPLEFVTEFWQRACSQIRAAGFKLEKRFGEDAKLIIDEAIDNIVADSMNSLSTSKPIQPDPPPEPKKTSRRRKKKGGDDEKK